MSALDAAREEAHETPSAASARPASTVAQPGGSADSFERRIYCVLGLPFDAVNMSGALETVWRAVAERAPCFISTPNLNFVVGSRSDAAFRDSVLKSDLCIADGMPIVWVARLLGVPIRERVGGATLFELLYRNPGRPLSIYLFGGGDGVAQAAARRLTNFERGVVCCGFQSPGFGSVEELSDAGRIARINASGADFLIVSLGAKKGQAWIERNRARLNVPVVSHLGAALNFTAGTLKRAPEWMQRRGLEWLWRIREEPGLWRRYARDGAVFLRLLFSHVLPLAWMQRAARPGPEAFRTAAVEIAYQTDGERVIRVYGAWSECNLDSLRACFRSQAAFDGTLRLDLTHATYVDAAFIGLIMLLAGERKRRGRTLECGPVNGRIGRILRLSGAEFLVSAAPAKTARGTAAALAQVAGD